MEGNTLNNSGDVKLKRTLTLPLLIMFGMANTAPTAVTDDYGIMTNQTHGMIALAYAITTFALFFTAYSYCQMVKEYPQAGSAYTYASKSIQPHIGFMTGWVLLIDYLLGPMICYLYMGTFINEYFPQVPMWLAVVISVIIGAAVNIIGVRSASIVDTILVVAQMAIVLATIIVAIKFVMDGGGDGKVFDAKAIYNPETFDMSDTLAACGIMCTCFLGFDAVTTLVEETKDPDRVMSKAVMGTLFGSGLIFIITGYALQIGWPNAYKEFEDPNVGIFEFYEYVDAQTTSDVFFVIDNVASLVCAMAGLTAVTRILYGMGRDNILPKKFFGKLSPRFHTPVNNIVLVSLLSLSAILYEDNLYGADSLVSFGAILGFIMVNISVISHFFIRNKGESKNTFKHLIMPGIGAVILIIVFINLEMPAKILGSIWLAIGFVYLLVKTKGLKELPPEMNLDEDQELE